MPEQGLVGSSVSWETLPLLRQRYRFEPVGRFAPPPFPGSMFHGALGHALKEVACRRPRAVCAACPLARECAYAVIFEPHREGAGARGRGPARLPAAYLLEWTRLPPRESGCYVFDVLLIGQGTGYASTVATAVARAADTGLGSDRVRQRIVAAGWIPPSGPPGPLPGTAQAIHAHLPSARQGDHRFKLRFLTPVAIKCGGIVARHLTAPLICGAAARRLRLIAGAHGREGPREPEDRAGSGCSRRITQDETRWYEWHRLSTRQERHIHLGGLLGTLEIAGLNSAEARALLAASVLHVGKAATMGMGRIDVCPAPEDA